MEQAIQDKVTQPTGFAAFGWGLLGWFGANLIINIVTTIGAVIAMEISENLMIAVLLIMFTLVVAFFLANEFRTTRTYQATATGAAAAMWVQGILFVLALIGEMA